MEILKRFMIGRYYECDRVSQVEDLDQKKRRYFFQKIRSHFQETGSYFLGNESLHGYIDNQSKIY